jgi:hypothetical protein
MGRQNVSARICNTIPRRNILGAPKTGAKCFRLNMQYDTQAQYFGCAKNWRESDFWT